MTAESRDPWCRSMKATSGKEDAGFPITNVGNDRRGVGNGGRGPFVGNDEGRSFVGNGGRGLLSGMTEGGSFRMGERDTDDLRDENHEATDFFPANGHTPAGPPRHARKPLPVMPAQTPFLSCPQFLAGIQSK